MKGEIGIILGSMALVLVVGFLFFQTSEFGISSYVEGEAPPIEKPSLSGLAILDELEGIEADFVYNETNATKEEVEDALNDAQNVIDSLQSQGFSTDFETDNLEEARRIFEILKKKEQLGKGILPPWEERQIRSELAFVSEDLSYDDVMSLAKEIILRGKRAPGISDVLNVIRSDVARYEDEIIKEFGENNEILTSPPFIESTFLMASAQTAFDEGRYDEAQDLLNQAKEMLEEQRALEAEQRGLVMGAQNFVMRNWRFLSFFVIFVGVVGYFVFGKVNKVMLKNKIQKLKSEKEALVGLIKRAQIDRFKTNKIPALVYNIRMKKYKERLARIKEELPVLEGRFHKKTMEFVKKKMKGGNYRYSL